MPASRIAPVLFVFLMFVGCDSAGSFSGDVPTDLAPLEVHFQGGLAGEELLLEIDGRDLFEGSLSREVPFSGPVAVVSEAVAVGPHKLRVTVFRGSEAVDAQAEFEIDLGGPLYVAVGFNPEVGAFEFFATEDPLLYQ